MYKVYAITDIGVERTQNQDGIFIDGAWCTDSAHREIYYETDSDYINVAVCDGVGSTRYAVEAVRHAFEYMAAHKPEASESDIEKYVLELNAYVYDSLKETDKSDGACTIVGVLSNGSDAYVYNIGDSPAYGINNGYLEKHSVDDTGASLLEEEVDEMPGRPSVKPPLIQSIGTYRLLDQVHIKHLNGEDAFLLCSDGISDLIGLDEMEDILDESDSLKSLAQIYVEEANARGGYDNSSLILLVKEEE